MKRGEQFGRHYGKTQKRDRERYSASRLPANTRASESSQSYMVQLALDTMYNHVHLLSSQVSYMRHGIGFASSRYSPKYLALSREGPCIATRHSEGATPSWSKDVEQDTDPEDSICAT